MVTRSIVYSAFLDVENDDISTHQKGKSCANCRPWCFPIQTHQSQDFQAFKGREERRKHLCASHEKKSTFFILLFGDIRWILWVYKILEDGGK